MHSLDGCFPTVTKYKTSQPVGALIFIQSSVNLFATSVPLRTVKKVTHIDITGSERINSIGHYRDVFYLWKFDEVFFSDE